MYRFCLIILQLGFPRNLNFSFAEKEAKREAFRPLFLGFQQKILDNSSFFWPLRYQRMYLRQAVPVR